MRAADSHRVFLPFKMPICRFMRISQGDLQETPRSSLPPSQSTVLPTCSSQRRLFDPSCLTACTCRDHSVENESWVELQDRKTSRDRIALARSGRDFVFRLPQNHEERTNLRMCCSTSFSISNPSLVEQHQHLYAVSAHQTSLISLYNTLDWPACAHSGFLLFFFRRRRDLLTVHQTNSARAGRRTASLLRR